MDDVNLRASRETRAQILQLIALEKLANGKDYTIKSYLEHLVSLTAHGNFDEAGKLSIEVKREPVTLRADGAQLRAAIANWPGISLKEALEGNTQLRAATSDDDKDALLFGQGAPKKDE